MSSTPTANHQTNRPFYPEGTFCCGLIFAFLCAGIAGGGIGYAIKPHNKANLLLGGIFGVCGLILLGLGLGAGIKLSSRRTMSQKTSFCAYNLLKDGTNNSFSVNAESPA